MTEKSALDEIFEKICSTESPLHERLAAFAAGVEVHGQPFAIVYRNLIAQLKSGSAGETAPEVGDLLPAFLLPDHAGQLIDLSTMLHKGPLVISFNRGHWCEFCELELLAFASAHAEFARLGAQVVSIMPERSAYTRSVRALTKDTVTVLSDIDNGYALTVGLVIWLGEDVRSLYQQFGLDLERYQGNGMWFVPIPATFVIDSNGQIIARRVDPDFRTRMDVEDVLEALKTAQRTPLP